MSSDPDQFVGKQIDQYVIERHIARGGMADVYLARDESLGRRVALKVLLPALAADDQYVTRFQREAQAVAQLDHPNIVHVYGVGVTDTSRPFIAMQYVQGGILSDTMQRVAREGTLVDTKQALGITGKMADALAVAHEAGIVHRDVKPSNILIRPDGKPVLVDLGIAAVEGGPKVTQTGTLVGTPFYMSPEQASGKKVDGRSDLYSLGVILYELLSGKRPFEAEDPWAVLHKHVYEEPTPLSELRPDLSQETIQLVQTCLYKDPDHRFQSASEMRQAINRALQAEGGPGMVTDAGVWEPYPSSEYRLSRSKIVPSEQEAARSRRWRWLLLLLPLLLIGGVVGAYLLNPGLFSFLGTNRTRTSQIVIDDDDEEEVAVEDTAVVAEAAIGETAVVQTPEPTSTFAVLPTFTPLPTETPPPTPTVTLTPDLGPERVEIGRSLSGAPIEAVRFGAGENVIVFIGGLHAGFAPATVTLAEEVVVHFTDHPEEIPAGVTLYILLNANPDSRDAPGQYEGRLNANGVDLNRNWDCRWTADARWRGEVAPGSGGPAPFSEPETQLLRDFLLDLTPTAVVFWEARADQGLASAGVCGNRSIASGDLALSYGRAADYTVADFENLTNQELNGDGTNWLDDQGIPAVAILLPDYDDIDWVNNLAGMRAVLRDFGQE